MLIIDRFEGETAICESGAETLHIPRALLPGKAREGDVLTPAGDGLFAVDEDATAMRRALVSARFRALTRNRPRE